MPPPAASDLALQEQVPTTEAQRRRLLFGVLGPPLAWFAQLQANYALVTWVCSSGHRFVLVLISLVAVGASVAAGYVAWTSWPSGGRLGGEPRGVEGARLLSLSGVATAAAFALVILTTTVPMFILRACD